MKKFVFITLIIIFFGTTFWENMYDSWIFWKTEPQSGKVKILNQNVDLNATMNASNDLDNIKAEFCNPTEQTINTITDSLTLKMKPWQRKKICTVFFNISDKPINILFWFSEWTLDINGDHVCDGNMANNKFSKSILQKSPTEITIPAQWNVIKMFYYLAPKTSSWDIYGCLAYKINKSRELKEGDIFLIVVRKIRYLHMIITWNKYNFWWLYDIQDIYEANKNNILSLLVLIIWLWLIVTIFTTIKSKENHNHKKK